MSAPCPVYGFVVALSVAPDLDAPAEHDLWESFAALAAARGLTVGRGSGNARWSRTVSSEAGQATDADRHAVVGWARERNEIVAADVGPLVDLSSVA